MSKKIKLWFIFFGMPVFAIVAGTVIYLNNKRDKQKWEVYSKQYWEQCDVEFCGVVTSKKEIYRGAGYVCLDLAYANKPSGYTLYINDKVFVCQIKDDKILFVTEAVQLEVGDSICYNMNGSKNEVRYRNGKKFISFENRVFGKTYVDYNPNKYQCE
ncbi:hypothetical protein LS482_09665 [Sinomicrobium kalidii]|uniref:hypothetical protein n=1 Tax=Sinomicrobium kalidii TaxID=2900738 RepID=UPI001E378BE4|nr:hypothetical protein [Sinomicrobium kalidii]UGU18134.1 hypothetical protein LS482_09665 [Sinomicrobium kalidii]